MSPLVRSVGLRRGSAIAPPDPGGNIEIAASTSGGANIDTSHSVDIPAGSGGLLVIAIRSARGTGTSTPNAPAGWTQVADTGGQAGGDLAILARVADDSEGDAVTVDFSASGSAAWVAYRVTGSALLGSIIEAAVDSQVDSPPNLTPSWGAANNLWIAVDSIRGYLNDFLAAPADYEGLTSAVSAESGAAASQSRIATAHRALSAATEDPGAFGRDGSFTATRVATIAVRPA